MKSGALEKSSAATSRFCCSAPFFESSPSRNNFRFTRAREHSMRTEIAISGEHVTNNEAVRRTLLQRGIRPESLAPAEDVKKVERRVDAEHRKALRNPESLQSADVRDDL